MPQVFRRSANTLSRASIVTAVLLVATFFGIFAIIIRSPYITRVGVSREQPVQFSHKHHSSDLGIQCRYCHNYVEVNNYSNLPPTQTCMSCHSQIWINSPMLEPVRQSYRTNESLVWTRVHDLPDYVYFNHSIHLNKGFGCSTCHGPVQQMQLVYKANSLYMEWCLDCHRNPEKYIRPRDQVHNMDWTPGPDQLVKGAALVKEYHVQKLIECYTCHR